MIISHVETIYVFIQIWLSLVMGRIVEMTGLAHYYIIVACVSGLAATFMASKVVFSPQDIPRSKN